jgi:hypothetical protein
MTSTHDDVARRARLVTLGFVVVSIVAVLVHADARFWVFLLR